MSEHAGMSWDPVVPLQAEVGSMLRHFRKARKVAAANEELMAAAWADLCEGAGSVEATAGRLWPGAVGRIAAMADTAAERKYADLKANLRAHGHDPARHAAASSPGSTCEAPARDAAAARPPPPPPTEEGQARTKRRKTAQDKGKSSKAKAAKLLGL